LRSRTSTTMVSLFAQSLTSSYSRPQNNSSIPCGLVILKRNSILIHNFQERVSCDSTKKRGLFAFSYRSQRREVRRNKRKDLLI
jgi:hypothetical protein